MASISDIKVLQLGPPSNGVQLSPWEFDAAEFEPGWRYELVNGVLIVNPARLRGERDPNDELGRWLPNYQMNDPHGASLDLTVPEETVYLGPHRRRVDRAIWTGLGRLPHEQEPPTIAVEFVSEGRAGREQDYDIKRNEYLGIGVREYWIIDRFARQMTVYRIERERTVKKIISARQTYTTPLLPGFKLPLGQLLKLADRWNKD